jgi:hypothetical protein
MAQSLAETHFLEFYNKINFVADVKLFRDNNSTNGSEMNNKITEFSKKDYKISPCDTFTLIKDITSIHTKNYKNISDIPGKSFPIGTLTNFRIITITNTFSYNGGAAPTYLDTSLCNIFKYDTSNSSTPSIPSISDLHYIYSANSITSNIKQLFTYKNGEDSKYVWEKRKDMLYSFHKPILLTFDIYYYNRIGYHLFDASFDINSTGSPTSHKISVDDISTLAQFKDMKPTFFTLLIYYAGYNFHITSAAIEAIYYSKFNERHTFAIQQYVPPTNESIFINTDSITPIIPNNINLEKETLELFHVGQIDSLWDYVNGKLTILILNMLKHPTEKGIYEKMFKTSYTSNNLFLLDCIEALEKYKKYITSAEEIKNIAFPRSTIKTIEILLIKFSHILSKLEPSFIPNDTVTFNVKVKDTTFTYVVNSQYKATKVDAITISSEMIGELKKLHDIFDSQTKKIDTLGTQILDVTTKIEHVKTKVDGLPAALTTGAGASAASVAASAASSTSTTPLSITTLPTSLGVSPAASAAAATTPLGSTPGIMPADIVDSLNTDIKDRMLKVQTIFNTKIIETSYNVINTDTAWENLITTTTASSTIELSFNQFIIKALNKIWIDTSNTQQAMIDANKAVTNFTKPTSSISSMFSSKPKPETKADLEAKFLAAKNVAIANVETYLIKYSSDLSLALSNLPTKAKKIFDELATVTDSWSATGVEKTRATNIAGVQLKKLKTDIIIDEINKTVAYALRKYDLSYGSILTSSTTTTTAAVAVSKVIPGGLDNPTDVSGIPGCRKVTITWNVPSNTSQINGYIIKEISNNKLPVTVPKKTTNRFTINDLSNEKLYTFKVHAFNKKGESSGSESIIITPNSDDCSFTKQTKATMYTDTTNSLKKLQTILEPFEFKSNPTPFTNYEQFSTFYNKFPSFDDPTYIIKKLKNPIDSQKIITDAINDVWKDISKNHITMQEADLDKNFAQFDIAKKAALLSLSNYKVQCRNDLSNAITMLRTGSTYNPSVLPNIIKIESKYWAAWSLNNYYIKYKNTLKYPLPTDVSGVVFDKGVTISWKAPKDTCGNTIAYYTVSGGLAGSVSGGYYTESGEPGAMLKASSASKSAIIGRDISNIKITDLSNGKLYTFTVSIVYDDNFEIMYSAPQV